MVVNLAADDVRAAYYCCAEVVRHRQRAGQPIPDWLSGYYARLDAEVRNGKSRLRHQSEASAEQLEPEKLITAREVAMILDLSKRHVYRLAADLDGRFVGNRWLFDLDTVTEYAQGRRRDAVRP